MRFYLDCLPCYLRQAIEAVRMVTDNKNIQEKVLRESIKAASRFDPDKIGLITQYEIQKVIRRMTPGGNPYKEVKEKFNKICSGLSGELRNTIKESSDPFQTGLRIALAGNIIDSGPEANLDTDTIKRNIEEALAQKMESRCVDALRQEVGIARKILYIGDNAGEIVFDKLFIENLPVEKITYVVRGGPALNDVTIEDARISGIDKIVRVITTGLDMTAAILPLCSREFMDEYEGSDLVIAKGQGNYEALSDEDRNIFFLLKIKCPVIADSIGNGYGLGDILVYRKNNLQE